LEGVEMGLVPGRDLERGRIDLDEIAGGEEAPERRLDPVAAEEEGAPVRMDMRRPPGGGGGHDGVSFQGFFSGFHEVGLAIFARMG
jgi:hypothetical protein